MKTLLITTITIMSLARVVNGDTDKVTHFSVSYGLSYTGLHLLKEQKWLAPVLTLAIGLVKELTDDKFDNKDMAANALGIGFSVAVFEFE